MTTRFIPFRSWDVVGSNVTGDAVQDEQIGQNVDHSTLPDIVFGATASQVEALVKRIFDLVFSVVALVVTAPVLLVLIIIIRLSSSGPAIFRQTRIGFGEKSFTCLKLRTMRANTRGAPSHEISSADVTPFGRFLRRNKLDELPQLWNIATGDMSFVGPRPCLPSQTKLIAARRKLGLYKIRPGITGVAQVAGVDMSAPERLAALDATYLGDTSLRRDLSLIRATVAGAGRGDRVGMH